MCIICSPSKGDVENGKEITAVVLGPYSITGAIIVQYTCIKVDVHVY